MVEPTDELRTGLIEGTAANPRWLQRLAASLFVAAVGLSMGACGAGLIDVQGVRPGDMINQDAQIRVRLNSAQRGIFLRGKLDGQPMQISAGLLIGTVATEGAHTLVVEVLDARHPDRGIIDSIHLGFTIDKTAPTLQIAAFGGAARPTVCGRTGFLSGTVSDLHVGRDVEIHCLTTIPPGASSQFQTRDITVGRLAVARDGTFAGDVELSQCLESELGFSHSLRVSAKDLAGNSSERSIDFDVIPPDGADESGGCPAPDECSVGFCSPITGGCAVSAKPAGPDRPTYCGLEPVVECVLSGNESGNLAFFGYRSDNPSSVRVPTGQQNSFGESMPDQGQPTWFAPGEHRAFFAVPLLGDVTWTLGKKTATAFDDGTTTCVQDGCRDGELKVGGHCVNVRTDAFLSVAETETTPAGTAAGATRGSLSVTDDGAVTYTVPLWVPPGRMGMQPDVALRYHSGAGDGPLGVGFGSLESMIARCTRTFAQDGEPGPIAFDSTDRLCLDGQRLVLVAGTYGAAGSEYRTERESFSKITLDSADEQGPTGFTVFTKDGRILKYGTTSDSRVEGPRVSLSAATPADPIVATGAHERYAWALSSVHDRSSNAIHYRYANAAHLVPGVEHLLEEIRYTGRGDARGRRSVRYMYETKGTEAQRELFVAGFKLLRTRRIKAIKMFAPDLVPPGNERLWREYRLKYAEGRAEAGGSITGRTLLQSVEECDGQGVCLPPTKLEWETGNFEFEHIANPGPEECFSGTAGDCVRQAITDVNSNPAGSVLLTPDLNGDGRDDLFYRVVASGGGLPQWCWRLSSALEPRSFSQPECQVLDDTVVDPPLPMASPVDFTRDGIPELVQIYGGAFPHNRLWFRRNTGVRYDAGPGSTQGDNERREKASSPGYELSSMSFADLDGDGLPEAVRIVSKAVGIHEWAYRPNSAGTLGDYVSLGVDAKRDLTIATARDRHLVDVDGDGTPELLVDPTPDSEDDARLVAVGKPRGTVVNVRPTTLVPTSGDSVPDRLLLPLDLNGDGLLDFVEERWYPHDTHGIGKHQTDPSFIVNTGNGFEAPVLRSVPDRFDVGDYWREYVDGGVRIIDFDMDGRHDLLVMGDGEEEGRVVRSRNVVLFARRDGFAPVELAPVGGLPDLGLGDKSRGEPSCSPLCPAPGTLGIDETRRGWAVSQTLDANGDGLTDLVQMVGGQLRLYLRKARRPDLLVRVADGFGVEAKVTWKPVSDPTVYTGASHTVSGTYDAETACPYPRACVRRGRWLAARVDRTSGETGDPSRLNGTRFEYYDGRSDLAGRGFLGFERRRITSEQTGAQVYVKYDHTTSLSFPAPLGTSRGKVYPLARMPVEMVSTVRLDDGRRRTTVVRRSYDAKAAPSTEPRFIVLLREVREDEIEEPVDATVETALGRSFHPPNVSPPFDPDVAHEEHRSSVTTLLYDDHADDGFNFEAGDFANVTRRTIVSGAKPAASLSATVDHVTVSDMVFENRGADWLVGLPTRGTTTDTEPAHSAGGASIARASTTRTVASAFDGAGLLQSTSVEPDAEGVDAASLQLTTTIDRNADGTISGVTDEAASGAGGSTEARAFTLEYDAEGIFPRLSTNALGHVERTLRHPALGVPVIHEDENGARTAWQHDGFGRVTRVELPGVRSAVTASYGAGRVVGAVMTVKARQPDGMTSFADLDAFGRAVRREATAFGGGTSKVDRGFDRLGRLIAVTEPYSGTPATIPTTALTHDALGRLRTVTRPVDDPAQPEVEEVAHRLFSQVSTDARGHERALAFDHLGRLTEARDMDPETDPTKKKDSVMRYGYRPFSLPALVSDGRGNLSVMEYDVLGRRRTLTDPDTGTTTTTWNAFGETTAETDANGTTATFIHDALGRVTSRTDTRDGTATFAWDPPGGLGRLDVATGPASLGGVVVDADYDEIGRPTKTTWSIGGASFAVEQSYDDFGRLEVLKYPEVPGRARFAVRNRYQAGTGYLEALDEDVAPPTTGRTLWTVTSRDPDGRLLGEAFGDGTTGVRTYHPARGLLKTVKTLSPTGAELQSLSYEWDASRNLAEREDGSSSERFGYDHLDRLKTWEETGTLGWRVEYGRDEIGNLLSRTYTAGGGGAKQEITYSYPTGAAARPHAVQAAKETVNGAAAADLWTFGYDAAGNRTTDPRGSVTYTSFDLPRTVGGTTFDYDAVGTRARKVSADGSTTIYVGGVYERRTKAGVTTHVFHVAGPEGGVATVEHTAGGTERTGFLHRDHLGTPETITGGAGVLAERKKTDPYGNVLADLTAPRLPTALSDASPLSPVREGLTGHEGDDDLGLVNLRGRMYDPRTGTFTSADPLVQAPHFSQSFNRYAYVFGNPLKYVDPSGFQSGPNGDFTEDDFECDPTGEHCWFKTTPIITNKPQQPATVEANPGAATPGAKAGGECDGEECWNRLEDLPSFAEGRGSTAVDDPSTEPPPPPSVTRPDPNLFPGGLWGGQVGGRIMARPEFNPDLRFADAAAEAGLAILPGGPGGVAGKAAGRAASKPGFWARTWAAVKGLFTKSSPRVAESGKTLARAIEQGLVKEGGKLAQVLRGIERGYAEAAPKSAADALGVIKDATRAAGLDPGIGTVGKGGEIILQNVGGIATTISAQGSILVQRRADILLHLLP